MCLYQVSFSQEVTVSADDTAPNVHLNNVWITSFFVHLAEKGLYRLLSRYKPAEKVCSADTDTVSNAY